MLPIGLQVILHLKCFYFVNILMLLFSNGKIGMGSPCSGKAFWMPRWSKNEDFINGAKNFFTDFKPWYVEADYRFLSSVNERQEKGRYWAFQQIEKRNLPNETIHFIGHSMGCAFTEGVIAALDEAGFTIGKVVHINCFQAANLQITTFNRSFTVDYQMVDDPLINNPLLTFLGIAKPGAITGTDYSIRIKSGIKNIFYRHRGPIGVMGKAFWEDLSTKLQF